MALHVNAKVAAVEGIKGKFVTDSGVMSWYSGTTNSGNSSEIFLHNAGLADNNNAIYLRTLRVAGSKTLKLQIACKVAATGTDTLTFKFRRLI